MRSFALRICCTVVLFVMGLQAQTTREEFLDHSDFVGGLYRPYPAGHPVATPAPEGYAPFYISHYGRHGSRWLLTPAVYSVPKQILGDAEHAGVLTALGTSLFARMSVAAEDAMDRYGDLSPLGVAEQRGIAERMMRSSPEVFSTEHGRRCVVHSRSTQVPRCILSMAAHNERLKELNPALEITRDASKRDTYLNNDPVVNRDTVKAIVAGFLRRHFDPRRLMTALFTDTAYARAHIPDQTEFANHIFSAAINMPNLDHLHISMMDVFTPDEMFILWQASNLSMYSLVGPSAVNGTSAVQSASLLLKEILACADAAVNGGGVSADLRFGHDSYIIPLLALMDVRGMNMQEPEPEKVYTAWSNFKASPMGANLQLIFYRNGTNGDCLVKVLLCERETAIPVTTDRAPYYHWKDVKAYYEHKLAR